MAGESSLTSKSPKAPSASDSAAAHRHIPKKDEALIGPPAILEAQLLEHAKSAIRQILSGDRILLYGPDEHPILRESPLWSSSAELWRAEARHILDELLEKIEWKTISSEQDLLRNLRTALGSAETKYTFTPHDGTLYLPISKKICGVDVKVGVPIYGILALVPGVALFAQALSLSRRSTSGEPAAESHSPGNNLRTQFPTWRTIKLGIYKTGSDLVHALGALISIEPESFLEVLYWMEIAPSPTEIDLVKVYAKDLGLDAYRGVGPIYDRAKLFGLQPVPIEVAPQLLLQSSEPYEDLLIGIKPIPHHLDWVIEAGGRKPRDFIYRGHLGVLRETLGVFRDRDGHESPFPSEHGVYLGPATMRRPWVFARPKSH
jgi:hypothetical protein